MVLGFRLRRSDGEERDFSFDPASIEEFTFASGQRRLTLHGVDAAAIQDFIGEMPCEIVEVYDRTAFMLATEGW